MPLTRQILEEDLNNLAKDIPKESPTQCWTKEVKNLLTDLAKEKGYEPYASQVTKGGEWMCDVVWWDSGKNGLVRSIPLVAECEWGDEAAVWDDFQKLLVFRAAVRVMIFCSNSPEKASELVGDLKRQIQYFESSQYTDRYLFASYVAGEKEEPPFTVEEYVFRINP